MTQEHPITPPLELIREWALNHDYTYANELWDYIATQAARWGADQELEACCEWLRHGLPYESHADYLRDARRPKPQSLKEQAYDALDTYIYGEPNPKDKEHTYNIIRRALEALPDEQ